MRTTHPAPRHPGRILEEDFLSRLPEDTTQGELAEDFLSRLPEDTTQGELAERLAMSRPRLNDLIHGRRSVSIDTALRLARCFGTPPEFWLQAQLQWDLYQARRSRAQMREIERIEPWPLAEPEAPPAEPWKEGAEEEAEEREPVLSLARGGGWEAEGSVVYYEEFLRRRGILEEARRFARIQAQLDVLEPHRPEARQRLQHRVRISGPGLGVPPLPLRAAPPALQKQPAGGIL